VCVCACAYVVVVLNITKCVHACMSVCACVRACVRARVYAFFSFFLFLSNTTNTLSLFLQVLATSFNPPVPANG